MTKMMIYVQPSIYEDSALSHAIANYATAVGNDLGWVVKKSKLDKYDNWRSTRTQIMRDDYNVILLVGADIDYPYFAKSSYFSPSLVPFYCDREPYLVDGGVTVWVNHYKADRAVSILRADKQSLIRAFTKFKQINIGEKYKKVHVFGYDVGPCPREHYSIPTKYNYNYCNGCDQAAIDEALAEEMTLLVGDGHGNPVCCVCGKPGSLRASVLRNVKVSILCISGCNTNGWVTDVTDTRMGRFLVHLVVDNPYLHFYLGAGYGTPCGNISGRVLSQMLNGKNYAEAIMGVTIDQCFTAYGNPAFHLSDEGAPTVPPTTPAPPTEPQLPPAKTHIEFKSIPQGAEISLKKH